MTDGHPKIKNFAETIIFKLSHCWQRSKSMDLFTAAELAELCYRTRELIWSEPIILDVEIPMCIMGDIHGQFDDLLAMFDANGWPWTEEEIKGIRSKCAKNPGELKIIQHDKVTEAFGTKSPRYLFLGDYVDRGTYSVEVVTLLLALKLRWPDRIFMLRGNHESRPVNHHYGFYNEVKLRYSPEMYELFQSVFNVLPFTAIISKKIMCMHGGISSHLVNLDQFKVVKRPLEIPDVGVLADLTWADPDPSVAEYAPSPRGASFVFGSLALRKFLNNFELELIVRAHQVVESGYEFFDGRRLVTIFSAPNYCGQTDNTGSIMIVNKKFEISFHVFRPKSRDINNK